MPGRGDNNEKKPAGHESSKTGSNMHGGVTEKHDKNAGSGAFNQGSEQDPKMNEGVADGTPNPETVSKEKENPKSGNIGKNNAGGYEHQNS